MKKNESDFDIVFDTAIATIGLVFEGKSLIKLVYLQMNKNKSKKNKQFDAVKNTITEYLAGKSKVKI